MKSVDDERSQSTRSLGPQIFVVSPGMQIVCGWDGLVGFGEEAEGRGRNSLNIVYYTSVYYQSQVRYVGMLYFVQLTTVPQPASNYLTRWDKVMYCMLRLYVPMYMMMDMHVRLHLISSIVIYA